MENMFTYYFIKDGTILGNFVGPESEARLNLGKGWGIIPGIYDKNKYFVSNGQAELRKEMELTVKGKKITGVPNPTMVEIVEYSDDPSNIYTSRYMVTDGSIDFSSDRTGPFVLQLSSPEYLSREVVIQ